MEARKYLIDLYLDWRNSYLTLAKFAEHHGLREAEAQALLVLAKEVAFKPHPES